MSDSPLNPYQTSSEMEGSGSAVRPAASQKLFSIGSVMLAAFLGSTAAGGVLMAINFVRLGRTASAVLWGVTLILITLGIIWLAAELPEETPHSAFLVPQMVAMYFIASRLQGTAIALHQRNGGRMVSKWAAAGIGLGVGLVLVGGFFGVAKLEEESLGQRIAVGQHDEIYYSPGATEKDANLLGDMLLDELYFGEPPGTTVLITKTDGMFTISFRFSTVG